MKKQKKKPPTATPTPTLSSDSSSSPPPTTTTTFSSSDHRTLLQFAQLQARRGDIASARSLFRAATVAAPFNPFICVAWARAEARCCAPCAAAAAGGDASPSSPQSSSSFYSSFDPAIAILEAGARRCGGGEAATFAKGGALLREWAALEARRGNVPRARELFRKGSLSGDALLLLAWAEFERELLVENGGGEDGDPVAAREAARLAEEAAWKEDEARRRV